VTDAIWEFSRQGRTANDFFTHHFHKEYQAILPLRGKILNTWEVDSEQVLASNEIHDISVAILSQRLKASLTVLDTKPAHSLEDSRSLVCPENCGSKILIDKS
jgi:hypothetical protein